MLAEFTLSAAGEAQASQAGAELLAALAESRLDLNQLHILASPFSRTQRTAQLVCDALGLPHSCVETENALRERYFGPSVELQPHTAYEELWARDAADPCSDAAGGGQSVTQVAAQLTELLARVEAQWDGDTVLLVSHGDTLQILQAVLHDRAAGTNTLSTHRRFKLETGELRRLLVDRSSAC